MRRASAALTGVLLLVASRFGHADVRLVVDDGIVDRVAFERALHVEGVDQGTVTLTKKGDSIDVTVEDSERRTRTLSLADVPKEHHARVLALAASELSRSMPLALAPNPSTSPSVPAPASAAPAPAAPRVAPHPPEQGALYVEGRVGALVRAYPSTMAAFGPAGKLSLCVGIVCPNAGLFLGVASRDTSLGTVSTTIFRGSAGVDLGFRPRPWLGLATGPSVSVGTFGVSTTPRTGVAGAGFTAPSLDGKWSMLAAIRTGYFVWFYAETSLGLTAFGGSALVQNQERASDRGGFLEASIGVRFADDRKK